MFNVSLKVDRDILIDFQQVCETYFMDYYEYLYSKKDPIWYISWSNFEAFRLKLATTIIKKSTVPADKKFSFSVNINCYKEFIDFFAWVMEYRKPQLSPYFGTIFREQYQKVMQELTSRSHQLQHSKN